MSEHGPEVQGFLFSSSNLSEHWKRLDEFEGDRDERTLLTVALRGGETAEAHIYVLRGL